MSDARGSGSGLARVALLLAAPALLAVGTATPMPAQDAPVAAGRPAGVPMRPPLGNGADMNDWEAYFDRGARIFRDSPTEAGAYFYWASKLDPSRAEPYYARWANFLFRAKNEDIYAYLRGDEALWRRTDFIAADSLRTRAVMRNPFVHRGLESLVYDRLPGNFAESRDTRAWIAYTEGKFAQAVAMHTRTIDRGGAKAVWSRYDRALAAVAGGDMALALSDLRALVEELRRRDEADLVGFYASKHHLLYMTALVHNQLGDRAAARAAMGESTVENAAFAYGWAGLAGLSRGARQHAQAVTEYETALELEPNDGYLHFLHAAALFDLQRYEAAASAASKAIALEPYYAVPHFLLGRARERQGREAEAYPHFERFVALAPAKDPQVKSMKYRLELRAKPDTARPRPGTP